MKKQIILIVIFFIALVLSGCGQHGDTTHLTPDDAPNITSPNTPGLVPGDTDIVSDAANVSKRDDILFQEGHLYAAAYLGYLTIDNWDYYVDQYLDVDQLPIHYVSNGDYYLVIPRYDGMSLTLYVNNIETSLSTMRFQDPASGPFIVQCNASDIFADVTVCLEYDGETAEFSPFISLKDGTPMIGKQGLDLTKPGTEDKSGAGAEPYIANS